MQFTEEEFNHVQQEGFWSDEDLNRFKSFVEIYSDLIPEDWSLQDLSYSVSIFDTAEEAFWFIEEGQDFADLVTLLAKYDLSNVKEGQTTLAQHIVEDHNHYYKVKNGYVFFSES